jgi:diaminohydroxyphosphoribosylaminopyrimidine deaminase / 5-amino-6-(5-phosphoribosylamino)uracil reductase
MTSDDKRFMAMALAAARRAAFTSPNPKVGAVVMSPAGEVLGEGYHRVHGAPHAECDALNGIDASGATLYVTLEPCTVEGMTPPCAPMVIASGVTRVVVAMEDPDPRVRGAGIAALQAAGLEVEVGVLEDEARSLNQAYIHHRTTGLPFVTLKLALSIDGHLGAPDGSSQWITGEEARTRVHELRREVDAVLVGAGTVAEDDPSLTVRAVESSRHPTRVVLDSSGRTTAAAKVFDGSAPIIMATTESAGHDAHIAWKEAGAEIVVLPEATDGAELEALLAYLGSRPMLHVLCEGGARLGTSLLRSDLVDRLEVHFGPVLTGGGPTLGDLDVTSMGDAPRWRLLDLGRYGNDAVLAFERERG